MGNNKSEKIKIGKITSAVGLKGEVKIISYSDDPMRFEMLDHIFMYPKNSSGGEDPLAYYIENIRYKGIQPILKLEGIDDRNAAEGMRGALIYMDEDDLPELEEGQYYVRDIIGFEVVTDKGQVLGELKDVVTSSAQDLYVVSPHEDLERNSDLMIPGVPEFILDIDTGSKAITVKLPEGLMEI